MIHLRSAVALALMTAVTSHASAAIVSFHADLSPSAEVPPVVDGGSGSAEATLDTTTHILTYGLTFSGFSGPVTMAHFHGPAAPGANAGVVVPLGMNPTSPLHGSVTLTPPQEQQLMAGEWYANLHTAAHPKGAARGQMTKAN